MSAQERSRPSPLRSIIAGGAAGALEVSLTYPAEFAKTRIQLNRRLANSNKLPWPPFGKEWYAGCTALIAGTAMKAAVRFGAFEQFKQLLADENGKLSGARTILAGMGAGVTESVLAVTPSESIKTQLHATNPLTHLLYLQDTNSDYPIHLFSIDDRKSKNPRMHGFVHGTSVILRESGIRGIFKGIVPTTAKQTANSAVRFGSYTTLRQIAQDQLRPGQKLGTVSIFGIGGIAGLITVIVTQPLDTIKTRMQSLAGSQYKNSLVCGMRIVREEGILTLWSGDLPRLVRLVLSGGIIFTVYEKTIDLMDQLDPRKEYL